MGNRSSLLLREEEIAQIQRETGCKYFLLALFKKNIQSLNLQSPRTRSNACIPVSLRWIVATAER